MTSPEKANEPHIVGTHRITPEQPSNRENVTPLSLLDATTATFGHTSAIWLFERLTTQFAATELRDHLRKALGITLNAYPQWCGYLKAIPCIDHDLIPPEAASFPKHSQRYGRVYLLYGTSTDPGVHFVEATSTATADELYKASSTTRRPIWNRLEDERTLTQFMPSTMIVQALEPNEKDGNGLYKSIMAIQLTELACGGIVLATKITHPAADIAALTRFVRDWASVNRAILTEATLPILNPVFEPFRLDACAAGDINADEADSSIMKESLSLPLHRYDWWAPPAQPPSPFPLSLPSAGKSLPWVEWDTKAPVDQYTIHLNRKQIEHLWRSAIQQNSASDLTISRHDALLAHIWSCVVRARGLENDANPVHCDLVLGVRPTFQLEDSFMGSPTMMLNIELPARDVADGESLGVVANQIRETISTVNNPSKLAAHLHSIAYEESPQRIWQAFLGQRHILVTSWVRAGLYDIDFGFGSRIRYADGVVPCLDGCVLLLDSPPLGDGSGMIQRKARKGWAENGVDVTLPLRKEDMERLLRDPLLLPEV